jgi:uncharacterized membrane protein (DUF106 family)
MLARWQLSTIVAQNRNGVAGSTWPPLDDLSNGATDPMRIVRTARLIVLTVSLILPAASVALAQGPSLKNEEEVQLEKAETNVLVLQRKLFAARQGEDKEAIKRLEKQFKKLQKERLRLLRATWQM